MKVSVGPEREIEIREAFNGVSLITDDGEQLGICMRDGGFEFTYRPKNDLEPFSGRINDGFIETWEEYRKRNNIKHLAIEGGLVINAPG